MLMTVCPGFKGVLGSGESRQTDFRDYKPPKQSDSLDFCRVMMMMMILFTTVGNARHLYNKAGAKSKLSCKFV